MESKNSECERLGIWLGGGLCMQEALGSISSTQTKHPKELKADNFAKSALCFTTPYVYDLKVY